MPVMEKRSIRNAPKPGHRLASCPFLLPAIPVWQLVTPLLSLCEPWIWWVVHVSKPESPKANVTEQSRDTAVG